MDQGNTAFVLISAALVLLMTPGLAFFYGGMVKAKSVVSMMMLSFGSLGLIAVLWVLYGYAIAFSNGGTSTFVGIDGWFGIDTSFLGLSAQVADAAKPAGAYPSLAFVAFQATFAIITVALISGAIADRAKFGAWMVFAGLWATIVYFPVANWVFNFTLKDGKVVDGGWIVHDLGVIDFAGGTAVHINAGAAGLALAIILGKRVGWRKESMRPHSLPLVMLGAGLLWFGWFGFNAGSSLGANGLAGLAFMNTQVAAAAAIVGWLAVEKIRNGHATSLGAASGAVAGLVAITPACAFVAPWAAVVIGIIAGALCALAVGLKYKFGFDDSLDVVGVHLVGGIWGSLAIGLFGTHVVNSIGLDGLFYGGGTVLLGKQALGVALVAGYSFIATLIIGFAIEKTIGFRITKDAEIEGIDLKEHAESAYEYASSSRGGANL